MFSDLIFICSSYAFDFHEKIYADSDLKSLFLGFNTQEIFKNAIVLLFGEVPWMVDTFLQYKCQNGHYVSSLFSKFAGIIFNLRKKRCFRRKLCNSQS